MVTITAGAQWGDEGKGRIVDMLASEADMVIRCQGGDNAGHTVINEHGKFALHAVPSGIFNPDATCIIGAGTVINPVGVRDELLGLMEAKIDISRLLISDRAHLIMPYHQLIDELDEQRRGKKSIGTTKKGIAWCYADKAARCGIRAGDLRNMDLLRERLVKELEWKNQILHLYGHEPMSADRIMNQLESAINFIRPFITDTVAPVAAAIATDNNIILEGQLGMMRDLDWGAYPFVTSSSPSPAGLCAGAGVPLRSVNRVIGVAKAYTTAVGAGPFPTEETGSIGEKLREKGGEYGATTQRPRRCGWFDAVAMKWACQVAGFTELALTKIDILSDFPIKICTHYLLDGKRCQTFPTTEAMSKVEPVYKQMRGWSGDVSSARTMDELPHEVRNYIDELEQLVEVPITLVSVGAEREAMVNRSPKIRRL